jgi:hypothetical protein
MSYFHSPALTPGKKYHYTVRVDWLEDGGWVSQARQVPVEAGLVQAIYLQPAAPAMKKPERWAEDNAETLTRRAGR